MILLLLQLTGIWLSRNLQCRELSKAKYMNPRLRNILIKSGDIQLVEASRDPVWGIAKYIRDSDVLDPSTWRGDNILGKLLQDLRTELSS